MTIMVKDLNIEDTLSPIYGRKLGEHIADKYEDADYTVDFGNTDTYTTLFFNGMFGSFINNFDTNSDRIQAINNLKIINLDKSDVNTYKNSRDTVLKKLKKQESEKCNDKD